MSGQPLETALSDVSIAPKVRQLLQVNNSTVFSLRLNCVFKTLGLALGIQANAQRFGNRSEALEVIKVIRFERSTKKQRRQYYPYSSSLIFFHFPNIIIIALITAVAGGGDTLSSFKKN